MFYDALSVSSSVNIMSIGITTDTNSGNTPAADIPSIPITGETPMMDGTIVTGPFVSKATLTHVERLEVRKVGNRCTGLCIYRTDGVPEILGQWDPSQRSLISEIYNTGRGIPTSLSFRFSGSKYSFYVDDIAVGVDGGELHELSHVGHYKTFHVSQLDQVCYFPNALHIIFSNLFQPIAWWFTALYDEVVFWNGTTEEVTLNYKHRVIDLA